MTFIAIHLRRGATRFAAALLLIAGTPVFLFGQAERENPLRITVMTGGLTPRSPVIVAASGGGDTRLSAAPAFGVDLQYRTFTRASIYGSAAVAFATLQHGTSLGASVGGSSSDATIMVGTAGLVLDAPSDWFDAAFRPYVRGGGGVKRYSFTTPGASSFITGTGDFGLGFRAGSGSVEVAAEVRYLPSVFDQGKLPTRGIVAQDQRQTDILFGIGVTVRP
jgi:hypothetical protein